MARDQRARRYHVRQLRNGGLLAPTRTGQRRGALEHFYVPAEGVHVPADPGA